MVDVSNKQNGVVITVTGSNGNTNVTAKSDTAQYWSNASKKYSEDAKTSADQAEQAVNEVLAQKDSVISDIESVRAEAVESVTEIKDQAINSVTDIKNQAVSDVTELVDDGVTNVETIKNNAIQEVNTAQSNSLQAIKDKGEDVIADIEENGKSLPMFTPIWSDHIYNDASYLRADTFSWHNADIYVTGYEILEREYNNENCVTKTENGVTYKLSPNGFKIADASQNDTIANLYESSKAWFYIIDTVNRKFKLPREKSNEYKYLYFYVGNYSRPDSEINLGILAELANSQDLESVLASINEVKDNGIAEIEATTASGVVSVTAKTSTGLNEITTATTTGVNSVNNAATSGLSNIETLTTTGVNNVTSATSTGLSSIQSLIDTGVSSVTSATATGVETVNTTATDAKNAIQAIVDAGIPIATTSSAGIVRPDGSTITILNGIISAAVKSGDEWEYSKGTNSYIKHKTSGLIIQGGSVAVSGSGCTITFPKAFNTRCCGLSVLADQFNQYSGQRYTALSNTSATIVCYGTKCYWFAFGY